jgi:hypothetical protein
MDREKTSVSGMAGRLDRQLGWIGIAKTVSKDCRLTATWAQGS